MSFGQRRHVTIARTTETWWPESEFGVLLAYCYVCDRTDVFASSQKGMKRKVAPRSQGEMGFDSNMNEALSTAFGEEDDEETCDEE
ncbi:hypothetical protein V6N13_101131 [Hibiscus sabdariffa]